MKTILTISGLDPSGGAGLHADIKTAKSIGLYPASVVTSLTVQNSFRAEKAVSVDPEVIERQLRAIFEDMKIDCVKIGLVSSIEVAEVVADFLNFDAPKVLDPVIFASAGGKLGSVEAYELLLNFVDVTTPNLTEARHFFKAEAEDKIKEAEKIARGISGLYGCDVVITGGELDGIDVVCDNGRIYTVKAEFSPVKIHGTGCVYSTALACYLALGFPLEDAVRRARIFVLESVKRAVRPGKGFAVVNP